MIVPPSNLPPQSQPWADALNNAQRDARAGLSTLDGDIAARFEGLKTTMSILNNQVGQLTQYANSLQTVRIDRAVTSGWTPTTSWASIASLSIPVPAGATFASVYAIGSGNIMETVGYIGTFMSNRINIGGDISIEMAAAIRKSGANPGWWAMASNHTASLGGTLGATLNVSFDVRVGSITGTPTSTAATLICLTNFG